MWHREQRLMPQTYRTSRLLDEGEHGMAEGCRISEGMWQKVVVVERSVGRGEDYEVKKEEERVIFWDEGEEVDKRWEKLVWKESRQQHQPRPTPSSSPPSLRWRLRGEEGGGASYFLGRGRRIRQAVGEVGMEGVGAAASATTDTVIVTTVVAVDAAAATPSPAAVSIQSNITHATTARENLVVAGMADQDGGAQRGKIGIGHGIPWEEGEGVGFDDYDGVELVSRWAAVWNNYNGRGDENVGE